MIAYNGFIQICPDPATRSKCLADLEKKNPKGFNQLQPYQPGNDPTTRWMGQSLNIGGMDIPLVAIGAGIALLLVVLLLK
jgi:hypothetical protein